MNKTFLWIIGITLFIAFLLFTLPSERQDIGCYKQIAVEECGKSGYELVDEWASWNRPHDNILGTSFGFTCCEPLKQPSTRKLSEGYRKCEEYKFLKEDQSKCSECYQFFKRVEC